MIYSTHYIKLLCRTIHCWTSTNMIMLYKNDKIQLIKKIVFITISIMTYFMNIFHKSLDII